MWSMIISQLVVKFDENDGCLDFIAAPKVFPMFERERSTSNKIIDIFFNTSSTTTSILSLLYLINIIISKFNIIIIHIHLTCWRKY